MRSALFIAILAAFPAGARATDVNPSYRWIVENDVVLGCLEIEDAKPSTDPACLALPAASLACAGTHTEEMIKDIKTCRTKLLAKPAWLKVGDTMECAELGDYEKDGQTKQAVVQWLPDADCDHAWYNLSPHCDLNGAGELTFSPLSHFGLSDLIPEIMNLKAHETVPLEVYKKYDSKRIALTLNYRLYVDKEKVETEKTRKPADDYLEGTAIQMAFSDNYIDSIAKSGFLNQHQTHHTPATYDPPTRAMVEDRMLGYHLESNYGDDKTGVADQVRPKYSILGFQGGAPADSPIAATKADPSIIIRYGDVVAVFNNDVKDRTTFMMGDSLVNLLGVVLGGDPYTPPSNMRDICVTGVCTPKFKSADPLGHHADANIDYYVEAQVWGELTMKDVNHFLVNCAPPQDGFQHPPISDAALEKLKNLGKPIYQCEEASANGHVVRLFEGKPLR